MTPEEEQMLHAKVALLSSAMRALMASHPDPSALRKAWDGEMALLWPEFSKAFSGQGHPILDRVRGFQESLERLLAR